MTERRKTTTSTAVKARYNKKTYDKVSAQLPKELVQEFKKKCVRDGVSQACVLRNAIEKFLNE